MGRNQASTRHVRHVEKGQMLVSTREPRVEALSQVGHLSPGCTTQNHPAAARVARSRHTRDRCLTGMLEDRAYASTSMRQYFPGQACSRVKSRACCSYRPGSSLKRAANSGSTGKMKMTLCAEKTYDREPPTEG
eukprot:scaffold15304_cov72-Phaeocystis_antarctica.AAC.1